MQVTKTYITGSPNGEYLCSVTMEFESGPYKFQISGMRIIQTNERRILAMPSRRVGEKWADLLHPMDQQTRDFLEKTALEHYDNNFGPNALNR